MPTCGDVAKVPRESQSHPFLSALGSAVNTAGFLHNAQRTLGNYKGEKQGAQPANQTLESSQDPGIPRNKYCTTTPPPAQELRILRATFLLHCRRNLHPFTQGQSLGCSMQLSWLWGVVEAKEQLFPGLQATSLRHSCLCKRYPRPQICLQLCPHAPHLFRSHFQWRRAIYRGGEARRSRGVLLRCGQSR